MSCRWLWLGLVVASLAVAGCGPKNAPAGIDLALQPTAVGTPVFAPLPGVTPGASQVSGVMTYENLTLDTDPTATQLTQSTTILPVRAADVAALDLSNNLIDGSLSSTRDDGSFAITVPGNTQFRVAFIASTTQAAARARIQVVDPLNGNAIHVIRFSQPDGSPFTSPEVGQAAAITLPPIPVAPSTARPAGVANIFDEALDASDRAAAVNGGPLRLITLSWNPARLEGSDFSPNGTGSGEPLIRIRGGDSDALDTDEFDDDIIHHEYGHFFINEVSRDVSIGGVHNLDDPLYPTLAYSEGAANWFAGIVRGAPQYIDSQAITSGAPNVFLRFTMEGRGGAVQPRGFTSEASVHEVLWDLTDGVENRPTTDGDAIALTFLQMFNALRTLRGSTVYVVIQDLLAALVSTGAAGTAAIQQLLLAPENQQIAFDGTGDVFPERLEVTQNVTDTCVTRANVAAPGVDPRLTGANVANRFWRFNLGATSTVSISALLLNGAPGTNASGTNIDLYLLDPNNNLLGQSRSETPAELIRVQLGAGRFYIHVSGRPSFPDNGLLPNTSSAAVDFRIENN